MSNRYQSLYVNISDMRNLKSSAPKRVLSNVIISSLVLLLLFAALGKIYLDRQIKKMVREWQHKNEELIVLKKESENLALEQEKYMHGNHILLEAEKLELRPPEPGQVRTINGKQFHSKVQQIARSQNSLLAAR